MQIAKDEHAASGEGVDQGEQARRVDRGVLAVVRIHVAAQDPGDRFDHIVGDRRRLHAGLRRCLLGTAVPGADEDAARADRCPRLEIVPAIADDERPREVEVEIAGGPREHPGLRLAAVASLRVGRR